LLTEQDAHNAVYRVLSALIFERLHRTSKRVRSLSLGWNSRFETPEAPSALSEHRQLEGGAR
jgi:hypothetical protein